METVDWESGPFDIYLYVGCANPPAPGEEIPLPLREPSVFVRVMRWESRGFLGLDLLRPEVATIRKWFKEHHASVLLVPVAYRQPRVTVEEAYPIAEQFRRQKQSRRYPTLTWGPIVRAAHAGEACAWAFFSGSDELQRQGYVPGGLFACVDKLDGHVWTDEDDNRRNALNDAS